MNAYPIRLLMIVPVAVREAANAFALEFDPVGGANTFREPLFPVGQDPQEDPTHYWASTAVRITTRDAVIAAVNANQFPGASAYVYDLRTESAFPFTKLTQLGLTTKLPVSL